MASTPGLGCKSGSPPQIVDPGDQTAVVGQTLMIDIYASDADGDELSFDFRASGVLDLATTTSLTLAPDGHAVFSLTPVASQVGGHIFDFVVSDGDHESVLPISIEIKGAVGSGSVPVFRKPLGQGTVLDLERADCTEFEVEVEDPDSTSVELTVVPPTIAESTLMVDGSGLTGSWRWCPSREQREGEERYDLTLSADDGDNPATIKDYLVVLRKRSGENCPGEAPAITHAPSNFETLLDLRIDARVTDDAGLKNPPIVLYTTEDPGNPVDFAKLSIATMKLVDGDMLDGNWRAIVPNPTAGQPVGSTAKLYYIVEATDNDDAAGDCDHRTDDPVDGTHVVDVTNNGEGSAAACEPCSVDVQCGGDGDLCLVQGDESFCGASCSSTADCNEGSVCSADPVSSIDGASARQCIPNAGSCASSGGTCEDDSYEDDDTPSQAEASGVTAEGSYGATLCPGDPDWWMFELDTKAQVTVALTGAFPPDMDLALTDVGGVLIDQSTGLTSDEDLTTSCLSAGRYMFRVFSVTSEGEGGAYTLDFSSDGAPCEQTVGMGDCCVDNNSPGCEDPQVQSCVCAMDPFCCDTEWDNTCAGLAQNSCDACDVGGNEDCCTSQTTPGCTDAGVQACVCATDPWCCGEDLAGNGVWDAVCVLRVGTQLCAPACNPSDTDGPCCAANGTPGCEINTVEMCVCAVDPACCEAAIGWDDFCVTQVDTLDCGVCKY